MPKNIQRTRTRKYRNSKKKYGKKRNIRTRRYRHKGGDNEYDECIKKIDEGYENIENGLKPNKEHIDKLYDECAEEQQMRTKPKRKVVNKSEINQ